MAATVTKITEREGVTYVDFAPDTNLDALTVESTRDEANATYEQLIGRPAIMRFSTLRE